MATLTGLLNAISEPGGLWATIIRAFEGGVGSYILAVLLLTLIIRVVWAPVDTLNKKFNKKMMRNQAKLQPQLEKLEKQYAKDPQMLKKKQQELYQKANAGLGGGCLFMLIFMALNLTIFGSMFTTMNDFSRYKVHEQYESLKYSYANVLEMIDSLDGEKLESVVSDYENITVVRENDTISLVKGDEIIASQTFKNDYSVKISEEETQVSEVKIGQLVNKYITDDEDEETIFLGDKTVGEIKYSDAINTIATNYTNSLYKDIQAENSFLWIGNIWVADSPFKQSVLSYDDYKSTVGNDNVAENESVIYNAFMESVKTNYNATNGYFLLALMSIGISFLSIYLSNGIKKKKAQVPEVKQNKMMFIIMPLIMGIFALMYNSVFAFYLVVSSAINVLLTPLENLIIDKWEEREMKKEEEKNTVEYSRKKV